MLIISVESLRVRLSLPLDPGVTSTLTRAIEAAAPVLESMTRSSFEEADHYDVFCRATRGGLVPSGLVALELSTGFVQAGTVEVVSSNTIDGLSTGESVPVRLQSPELGHLFVDQHPGAIYYAVKYKAGFPSDGSGELLGIPAWLAEAATCQSIMSLSAMQVGDGKPGLSEAYGFLGSSLSSLIDSHDRRRAHFLRPIV